MTVVTLRPEQDPGLSNIEAEMGLLGLILENNRAYDRVGEFLRPDHFADPVHASIYEACAIKIEAGQLASPVTLARTFDAEEFASIGGHEYLADLVRDSLGFSSAHDYGQEIFKLASIRRIREIGHDILGATACRSPDLDPMAMVEETEQRLYQVAEGGKTTARGFVRLDSVLDRVMDRAQAAFAGTHKYGISTGIQALDGKLGGLAESDLLVLAARPGMGKTALATNIAWNIASRTETTDDGEIIHPDAVGFFSLEMSNEQLTQRILGDVSGVPTHRIQRGEVNAVEMQRMRQNGHRLRSIPLHIDDTPALTVSALRSRARRLKREKGLSLIVVDYIQLMSGAGRDGNRVNEVSDITRGLKLIAKELNIPVLALSQLSRAVESRDVKRPQLSDLRESGSIEQDADIVMFIYREEYYLSRDEPQQKAGENGDKFLGRYNDWLAAMGAAKGRAEVDIAKQRHGPTGTAALSFDGETTHFGDVSA